MLSLHSKEPLCCPGWPRPDGPGRRLWEGSPAHGHPAFPRSRTSLPESSANPQPRPWLAHGQRNAQIQRTLVLTSPCPAKQVSPDQVMPVGPRRGPRAGEAGSLGAPHTSPAPAPLRPGQAPNRGLPSLCWSQPYLSPEPTDKGGVGPGGCQPQVGP